MLSSDGYQIDPQRGAVRFWYRPAYDSGSGPTIARLLTLISTNRSSAATWWTLVVSGNGSEIDLLCQTTNGLTTCLSATMSLQAGNWRLLTLGFTETNSALFLDDQLVATGGGPLTVPSELAPFTSLVVGSGLDGQDAAAGQMDELAAFSGRGRHPVSVFGSDPDWEIAGYWEALSSVAALGPMTAEEQAAREERAARRQDAPGPLMFSQSFQLTDCNCATNGRYYLTNLTVNISDPELAPVVTFTICGGSNQANVGYDIFRAATLSGGDSLTNSTWLWLGRGFSCNAYELDNEPSAGAVYVLGDATLDPDGDGLSTSYELLISHTDPNVFSAVSHDGHGTPDAWYLAHGLDPLASGIGDADSDGDGIPNWQECLRGSNPASSEGWGIWIAQPQGIGGLP